MTIPEEEPLPPAEDDDKQLHIPGSGTIGILLLILSLTVLFIASIAAFLIIRVQLLTNPENAGKVTWPPPGSPPVPQSLWLSTLVILATSVTIQLAYNAIKKDFEKKLLLFLRVTFSLGLLFLIMQSINWWEFYRAIPRGTQFSGPYLGGFFILTGLHAAHVLGGLIPLSIVTFRASRGRYSRNFHPGIRYVTFYWHFLDIIWLILFCVIYF